MRAPLHVYTAFYLHLSLPYIRVRLSSFVIIANDLVMVDKPQDDPNIRGDAFKTLIVARLSYDATEQDLESEFSRYGPIERVCASNPITIDCWPLLTSICLQIRIVVDTHQAEKPNKKKKKHRGYAFVVYEREKDMRGKHHIPRIHPQARAGIRRDKIPFVKNWPSSCLFSPSSPFSYFCSPTQGIQVWAK